MKKNKTIFILLLLFFVSCSSVNYFKVNLQVPGKPIFDINQFDEIIVTDFFIKKETKDFDLNQELVNYFETQMKQNFKAEVSSRRISLSTEEIFKDKDFWKNIQPDSQETVLFTGTVDYLEEVRKAIVQTKKKADDTFQKDKAIEERRFYTLTLVFYMIDAQTGELLYTKDFKETQGYRNPNQTAAFAFFDLADTVRSKFFSNVLGTVKIQQRYLIKD
ncbi:MAG: hypothetical protein JSV46_07815 [Candidatus Aminicenantes bacterium]|nr:MAG: hypothetical protein JSV46_07815 [Candidatus Aminicenantes bacterium]